MASDHIIVVYITCFCDDAEEGAQLRSPGGQVDCCVVAGWRGDAVSTGVICFPGTVVAAPHEGGEAVVLREVDLYLLHPYIEEEVRDAFFWQLGWRIDLDGGLGG